jgi:glycosyltransferase involved in cell wall biosynthesis
MTYDPVYVSTYCLFAVDYNAVGIPTVLYATVEGVPKRLLVKDWMRSKVRHVANSKYTADRLKEVGINVEKVIPHGLNLEEFANIENTAKQFNRKYKERLGAEVVFGTVSTNHPRKNLETLVEVIRNVSETLEDAGFVVVTTEDGAQLFSDLDNCIVYSKFGKMKRREVLSMIGGFDFLIHPALCEGFGLPVLEAQALGVVPIHGDYAPLTEITMPEASFRVPIEKVELNPFFDGIMYTLHHFKPEDMVEKVKEAYELYTCNKEGYENMRSIAKSNALQYDANKLYTEFANLLT